MTYPYLTATSAMAFILAALLLREKILRTEASEEVEVLREQFKDLRTIIENDQAEYMRAYNTLHEAGYTDEGHALWTPPDRLENSLKWALKHRNAYLENRCQELEDKVKALSTTLTTLNEALADSRPNRGLSDDWPPYGHGIEAETKAGDES